MDTSAQEPAAPQHPPRRPLTSSLAVTALVILTSLLLEVLTVLLFVSAREAIRKPEQKVMVVAATILLSALALAGLVLSFIDLRRRFAHHPLPPTDPALRERLSNLP